jgi:transposase-like protein
MAKVPPIQTPQGPTFPARRSFSPEFKRDAVERALRKQETLTAISKDLGIRLNNLSNWVKQGQGNGASEEAHETKDFTRPHPEGVSKSVIRENKLLRLELEYLKAKDLILRK